MERRRLAAGRELLASNGDWGERARIARKYGVNRGTVSRWAQVLCESGLDGLRRRKPPGASSKLTDEQWERLGRMLKEGATAHGYGTDLWTGPRVQRLIKETFGIAYNPNYVVDILKARFRYSWQKPRRVARERDEAKRKAWLATTWEELKKGPRKGGGPSRSSTRRASPPRPSSGRRGRPSGSGLS